MEHECKCHSHGSEHEECDCHSHGSEHEECGCGEGCSCHDEKEIPVIYLTFDDSEEEVACDVIGIFPVDKFNYIAVVPQGEDEDEVLIYRYNESEDGQDISLDDIESDEEYERVSEEFYEIFFEEDDEE